MSADFLKISKALTFLQAALDDRAMTVVLLAGTACKQGAQSYRILQITCSRMSGVTAVALKRTPHKKFVKQMVFILLST